MDGHNVFFAQVETVAIFKNPPAIVPSPYKGRLTRRPHHRPQIPTTGEQINAAAAFVPQPNFASTSTSRGTGSSIQLAADVAATFAKYGAPSTFSSFDGHLQEVSSTSPFATPTTSTPSSASLTQMATVGSPASILTLTSDDGKGEDQLLRPLLGSVSSGIKCLVKILCSILVHKFIC